MLWDIFEISVNLFQVIIIIETITKYFGKKYNDWKGCGLATVTILIIFTVLTYINNKIPFEGLAIIIPIALIFTYAVIALKGSWKKKLFFSIMIMILVIGITTIVMNLMGLIFGKTYIQLVVQQNPLRLITVTIIQVIIFYCTRILTFKKHSHTIDISWKMWAAAIIIPCISIFILASVMELSFNAKPEFYDISVKLAVVISLGICVIDLLTYYAYIKLELDALEKMEHEILRHRYEMQKSNIEDIKNLYVDLHKIKHDVKHHMNLLKTLLEKNKIDEARKYLAQYADHTNLYNKSRIFSQNIVVNYVINLKAKIMEEKNINFFCHVCEDIVGIADVDLNILLGNLLDNAIEACEQIENKRELSLSMEYKKDYLIIKIKNTFNRNPSELLENITSKGDKENHGFGLRSVSDIVDKYYGHINKKYENNEVEIVCILDTKAE